MSTEAKICQDLTPRLHREQNSEGSHGASITLAQALPTQYPRPGGVYSQRKRWLSFATIPAGLVPPLLIPMSPLKVKSAP